MTDAGLTQRRGWLGADGGLLLGGAILVLVLVASIAANHLTQYDPIEQNLRDTGSQ